MRVSKYFKSTTFAIAIAMSAGMFSTPASAVYVDQVTFNEFKTQNYEVFKDSVIKQLSSEYQALQKAFTQLGKDMHDYFQEANVIGKNATSINTDIMKTLRVKAIPEQMTKFDGFKATDGGSALDPKAAMTAAQSTPGKIYIEDIGADMSLFAGVHNPTEAIALKAMLEMRNRLKDSNNVVGLFDTDAGDYKCASKGNRCTTLIALQEKVSAQIDSLQETVVKRGSYWLSPKVRIKPADQQYFNVFNIGLGGADLDLQKNPELLATFLSPAPMLTAGFAPAIDKGALSPVKANVLADILIGVNDFQSLLNPKHNSKLGELPEGNKTTVQTKILTRFARIQLARHAISSVTDLAGLDAINAEFKVCVVRPTEEDIVGSSVQQHLTNVENLLRCNNLSLLHLRRVQMEQSRLIAVLLSTQLEHYSFLTIDEEIAAREGTLQ